MFFHIFCCGRTHERHEPLHWVDEHTILCSKMSFLVYINVGLTPWKQHFAVPLFHDMIDMRTILLMVQAYPYDVI